MVNDYGKKLQEKFVEKSGLLQDIKEDRFEGMLEYEDKIETTQDAVGYMIETYGDLSLEVLNEWILYYPSCASVWDIKLLDLKEELLKCFCKGEIKMTREQLEEMTFEDQMLWAMGNIDCVTTEDTLKQFAIEKVEDDNFSMALHILNAIWNNPYRTEYYRYDYCMGILETPTPITELDDIEDLINFEEEI